MPKKQKDGRYRTKILIGTGPDDKPIYKWVAGKTKPELEEAKRRALHHYVDAKIVVDSNSVFGAYVAKWYAIHKEPFLSPSSDAAYRSMLNKHILPRFSDRRLTAITVHDLQDWLNELSGMSVSTITLAMTILRGVFTSAYLDRLIPMDPTPGLAKPKPRRKTERRALTPEERDKVVGLLASPWVQREPVAAAYLGVLYYLGVRPGEARGLQWGDIDWDDPGFVHVQRDIDFVGGAKVGDLKTPAADRYVPLPLPLRRLLAPMRGLPNTYIIPGSRSGYIGKSAAETLWLIAMKEMGLVEVRENANHTRGLRTYYQAAFTPYYLRHNYVTLCWEAGMDPVTTTIIVGHTDYQVTANIYTHLERQSMLKAHYAIDEVFAQGPSELARKKVAKKLPKL